MLRKKVVKEDTKNEGQEYSKNSKPQFERAKNLVAPVIQKLLLKNTDPRYVRILDVGCGVGDIAEHLACYGFKVDGLDSASEMIEVAKNKCKETLSLNFIVADAADFKFPYKFDLIISTSALQWISDDKIQQVFNLMNAHLKPGGELLFLVPTYDFPHIVTKDMVAFSPKWKTKFEGFKEPQSLRSAADYQTLLQKANFGDITVDEKKSTHEYTTDGFMRFIQLWCGCFHYLKDSELDKEFITDVQNAFEKHPSNDGNVMFEQTSLVGCAQKLELKLASTMTLGFIDKNNTSNDQNNTNNSSISSSEESIVHIYGVKS